MATLNSVINFLIGFLILIFTAFIFALFLKIWPERHTIRIRDVKNIFKKITVTSGTEYERITGHRKEARNQWEKILKMAESEKEQDLHLAIIKADGLMDEILREHGCKGEDMNERLKSLHPDEVKNLKGLQEAHRVRNRLAHESDFHISMAESKKLINIYHRAIEDLLSKELELSA